MCVCARAYKHTHIRTRLFWDSRETGRTFYNGVTIYFVNAVISTFTNLMNGGAAEIVRCVCCSIGFVSSSNELNPVYLSLGYNKGLVESSGSR